MTTADSTGDRSQDASLFERAFGGALVVDPVATRAARASFLRGGAEACGCRDCRAWLAARDAVLTAEVREGLAALGLDDGFETAVHSLEDDEGVELLFHLIGALPADADLVAEDGLPDAVLGVRVRRGAELAPPSWPTGPESLELSLRLWVPGEE